VKRRRRPRAAIRRRGRMVGIPQFGAAVIPLQFGTAAAAPQARAAAVAPRFGTTTPALGGRAEGVAPRFGTAEVLLRFGTAGVATRFGTAGGAPKFGTAGATTKPVMMRRVPHGRAGVMRWEMTSIVGFSIGRPVSDLDGWIRARFTQMSDFDRKEWEVWHLCVSRCVGI
jgi:hypothetical protein